jgi:hypothetical protein
MRNNGCAWMISYRVSGLRNRRRTLRGIGRLIFTAMSRPRHGCWANYALTVDPAVDKKLTLALQSLKPSVEGRRTTAGVEARSVIGQQTAEKVIHRLFGGQPEPEDLPALAVNDHVHGLPSRRFELLFEPQLATESPATKMLNRCLGESHVAQSRAVSSFDACHLVWSIAAR